MPDVSLGNLAFLGGIILLFTGMEMAGFHAKETRDPGRSVPRAIFLSVAIIVAFSVLGSLFLAIIIPAKRAEPRLGDDGALPTGARPTRRRLAAEAARARGVAGWHRAPQPVDPRAREGRRRGRSRRCRAPCRLGKTNDRDVPVELLIVQGIGGTIFSLLFLLVPSVSTSYWMLSRGDRADHRGRCTR